MKTCSTCGHVQNDGNFCGKCGGKLESQTGDQTAAAIQAEQPVQQNSEQLEKIKEQSKMYLGYFVRQLKSPSGQSDMRNSLISIGLYILLTVVAVYTLIKNLLSNSYFGYMGPSFFQILIYATIFFVLLIAISAAAVFLTSMLFSENLKYTEVINKFGGYYVIPIVLTAFGIVLALIKSYTIAGLSIYLGLIIAFGLIPVFVMIRQLSLKSRGIDSFYAYMFYLVINVIFGVIIGLFIADSAIGEMIDYF